MAWTSPRTWVAGEVVTAALLNTHLRDNLLSLGAWIAYTPVLRQGGVVLGVAANQTRYAVVGKMCTVHYFFQPNSAGTAPNDVDLSLPITPSASAHTEGVGSIFLNDVSAPTLYKLAVRTHPTDASKIRFSDSSWSAYFGTTPSIALATGDQFAGTITYEVP